MEIKHINLDNYADIEKEEYALVDFFATWCGPCRALSPIIENVADDLEGRCSVYKADVDELEEQCLKLHIMSVPTVILFNKGTEVLRIIGLKTKEYILEQINNIIK